MNRRQLMLAAGLLLTERCFAQPKHNVATHALANDCKGAPASPYQAALVAYEQSLGVDLFQFHWQWHSTNTPPGGNPNGTLDPSWGQDQPFGRNFLEMHHSMLYGRSTDSMGHDGLFVWCNVNAPGLLSAPLWDPAKYTSSDFAYAPRTCDIPQAILDLRMWQEAAEASAAQKQPRSIEAVLSRTPNPYPPLPLLPSYFTLAGIQDGEEGEPNTGFRRLSEFRNVEQLGCCLSGIHGMWHLAIGGAMANLASSIADPIFYFGVHRLIDAVYQNYQRINPVAVDLRPQAAPVSPTQRLILQRYDNANQHLTRSLRLTHRR